MSAWLDPLQQVLDQAAEPVRFFFRNDDAGWEDTKLYRLLDLFAEHQIALDVAVIPQALNESLAVNLCQRLQTQPDLLGLHQHGFSHTNHETEGRKYEFGPSRSHAQQQHDLQTGRARLQALLGSVLDPIFTPPWNRCTTVTAGCLVALGYRILSRDVTATPLPLASGLIEQSVSIDWLRQRKGVRVGCEVVGQQLAEAVAGATHKPQALGVMLHHAVMDAEDILELRRFLRLLAHHPQAHCQLMRHRLEPITLTYKEIP